MKYPLWLNIMHSQINIPFKIFTHNFILKKADKFWPSRSVSSTTASIFLLLDVLKTVFKSRTLNAFAAMTISRHMLPC